MVSPVDLHNMAVAILSEGRGESKLGQEAIAHVLANRHNLQKSVGATLADTVLQTSELSGMRPNDPNRIEAQKLADQNAQSYQDALQVAKDALAGKTKDPTNGATFYYADYIDAPAWSKAKTFSKSATIGQHIFYTAPDSEILNKAKKNTYAPSPIPITSAAHELAPTPEPRPEPPAPGQQASFPVPVPRPSAAAPSASPDPQTQLGPVPLPNSASQPNVPVPSVSPPVQRASNHASPNVPVPRAHPMSRPGRELPGTPTVPSAATMIMSNRVSGLPTQFQDQAQYEDKISELASIRRTDVNPALEQDARQAVAAVYGSDHTVTAFSGSQDPFGTGYKRTGSTRHDRVDDEDFGNAVDVHITDPDGNRLTGDALAPLAQYWAANNVGSIGVPTKGSRSGVHLDYIAGKGRDLKGGESQIWAYPTGSAVPKTVQSAFDAGLEGTLPTLREPQKAIHVSNGYTGPLYEIGAPYGQNVPPTPDNIPLPSIQMARPSQSFGTRTSATPVPAIQSQQARARATMETFGRVEPALQRTGNAGSAFQTPTPAPQMQGTQTGNVGSTDGYKTMRDYKPVPSKASFPGSTSKPTNYNFQPAPAPKLDARTVTQMVPTRVPVARPQPVQQSNPAITPNIAKQAAAYQQYGESRLAGDALAADIPMPTPKPEQTYETIMKPVTKEVQASVPNAPPAAPAVPNAQSALSPEEDDDRGFLSKLLGLPAIPSHIKNGARVGGMVAGIPGMAAGAYAGYMGNQMGGALFGRTPYPNSPYQARGVRNPNKTVGLFNRARTNSIGTGNGSGGPYEGETWRNTSSGGTRAFNPSTRQYEDIGGSNAGNRSESQTTGSSGGGWGGWW